jgi:hypothetical protein
MILYRNKKFIGKMAGKLITTKVYIQNKKQRFYILTYFFFMQSVVKLFFLFFFFVKLVFFKFGDEFTDAGCKKMLSFQKESQTKGFHQGKPFFFR